MINTKKNGAPRQESAAQVIAPTEDNGSTESRQCAATGGIDPQAVRQWAQPMLDEANKAGQIPWPGTPAWSELPDGDPRKRAAVIYAALFWCDQHTPEALAERAEFDEWDERRSLREASWAISRGTEWGRGQPSFAELERRRAVVPPSQPIDPAAVARWVQTGSSKPEEAAA